MTSKPLSVAFVAAEKDGENVILRFEASNGHSYSLILSPRCASQSAKALQDFSGPPSANEVLTLTATRVWTPVGPDNRQGIAICTREGPTMAIELPEGTIAALEAQLGAFFRDAPASRH